MVDDEAVVRTGIAQALRTQGLEVRQAAGGREALQLMAVWPAGIVLLDVRLPDLDGLEVLKTLRREYPEAVVIMITGFPNIEGAVASIRHGALDYLEKPFRLDHLEAVVRRAQEAMDLKVQTGPPALSDQLGPELDFIVGRSPAMQQVFAKIRRAAPSDSTVLLTGESGTGKELVARAIHRLSPRRDREFVPVDCSALVETLLESELFGHVKGSFTGAHQTKHGLFELANHGTFFFDEISNLSLNIQAKLLRVIQEREFMPVGSQKRLKLDIRIIASSNRDLREAVRDGTFREDLFYRLSVIPIHLPPLRERTGDLPLLVDHFIRKNTLKAKREVRGVSAPALKLLAAYPWPGNVRELEHTIERILILEDGDLILPEHLPSFITGRQGEFQVFSDGELALEEVERRYIQFILRRTQGNRSEAARILGINRKTLGQKIKKYALRTDY
uniref:Sigma-54-dependent Fis family transcriptional regulator n=1 Tax=Desulfobacca acetoxidans TaxID=60893 RepID=A0A7V4G9C0_9BACT